MESNSFFLQRAIARGADWHVSYPALCMAAQRILSTNAASRSSSRPPTTRTSVLGAILDFHASWAELDDATRGWLAFTDRWNRWWLPDGAALATIERHAHAPADVRFASGSMPCCPSDTAAFRLYLDAVESHYRRDEAISRASCLLTMRRSLHSLAPTPHKR